MGHLPGDQSLKQQLEEMIRVNHAGEFGAKRIYAGQMSILKNHDTFELLKKMADQEEVHLEYFNKEMQERQVRPSVFLPLWGALGYALGAGTAMLGKTSAMICTEAVEEVIDEHYQAQLKNPQIPQDIAKNIEKFRQEELEHLDIAQNNREELHLGHRILYNAIKLGCKASIALAKKF